MAAGQHKIFVARAGDGDNVDKIEQTSTKQLVFNPITTKSLSKAEATDPKVNIKLTSQVFSLKNDDIVTFSIPDINGNISEDKKIVITLTGVDSSLTTHSQSITFTKDGEYSIWIKRGSGTNVKQTSTITVEVEGISVSTNAITSATPLYKDDKNPTQAATLAIMANSLKKDDIISFTQASTLTGTILKHTVTSVPATAAESLTTEALAFVPGLYNIFITRDSESAMQPAKLVVFEKIIDKTTISEAKATSAAEVGKPVSIELTYATQTLYNEDKIIFSISSGDSVSETKKQITLSSVDFTKDKHSQHITFDKEGEYNIWIQRGEAKEIKQTKGSITVAAKTEEDSDGGNDDNGTVIKLTLAFLFGLLLF